MEAEERRIQTCMAEKSMAPPAKAAVRSCVHVRHILYHIVPLNTYI